MQRQSLGSPGSKTRLSGGGAAGRMEQQPEEEMKAEKQIRWSLRADRSIHLIPILTILCLLVLFLFSHDPSPADLEAFGASGIRRHDTKAVSGAERVSAMYSNRGLKAAARNRKLGVSQPNVRT
ncbi:hypothetical protein MUK42_30504 [Musa troglodytarum]|uniref:Uncharacterized protein n=1 Tax=Musa troglodytarum TaxID=320322 RepID=A0A9E7FLS7_9LILI|nr:hypothetical protein MUK42_30504 [Musa troglodytarum]URD98135.1 hypothetical protein MUK42_30504 [Musa troglodytarum]